MADVLLSLKHTVPTPQSSAGEQQQHNQAYALSANHNVSTRIIHDTLVIYEIWKSCTVWCFSNLGVEGCKIFVYIKFFNFIDFQKLIKKKL